MGPLRPTLKASLYIAGSVAGLSTLSFSSFILYFGSGAIIFTDISSLINFSSPVILCFAFSYFFANIFYPIFIMIMIFARNIYYMSKNTEILNDRTINIIVDRYLSGEVSLIVERIMRKGIIYKISVSLLITVFLFTGFKNFLIFSGNIVLLIIFNLFVVFIFSIFRNHSIYKESRLKAMLRSYKSKEIRQQLYRINLAIAPIFAAVIAFYFGALRADYIARNGQLYEITLDDSFLTAGIVGISSDGVLAFAAEKIVFIPQNRVKSIASVSEPNFLIRLMIEP